MGDTNVNCGKGTAGVVALGFRELLLTPFVEYLMECTPSGTTVARVFGYRNQGYHYQVILVHDNPIFPALRC